jgi:hypothetical protein
MIQLPKKINYKELIIPSVLIGYGLIGIESDAIKNLNTEIKEEVTENIDHKITIDDFLNTYRSYRLWFKCNGDKR